MLFAVGAVSGTVLSFEMGLLWPGLMSRFGDVIGLPFALEGIAFFVEAIFMGIYLYGWDRLPPRIHLLHAVPMMASGVFGTFCVVAVNAWMNAPSGFRDRGRSGGRRGSARPRCSTAPLWPQFLHMWVAAYLVVGFVVAGVYAAGLLRGRRDRLHRLGLSIVPCRRHGCRRRPAVHRPRGRHAAGQRSSRQAGRDGAGRRDRGPLAGRDSVAS